MIELGLRHETAWDLYQTLKEQADGDGRLSHDGIPDWSGIYTRPFAPFDPVQRFGQYTTAKLTPEYEARYRETRRRAEEGKIYDPISGCAPLGYPRWLQTPFLREFLVTPRQTMMALEYDNSVRRIYTDGRGHPPEEDRYPLYFGDSIGFWDGDRLIVHTNQLRDGIYTRNAPEHSDQLETVEIWEKTDARTIAAHVWAYDPPALVEPWYVKQRYTKLTNDDHSLRIRHFHCTENANNVVVETEDGASDFADFTFD